MRDRNYNRNQKLIVHQTVQKDNTHHLNVNIRECKEKIELLTKCFNDQTKRIDKLCEELMNQADNIQKPVSQNGTKCEKKDLLIKLGFIVGGIALIIIMFSILFWPYKYENLIKANDASSIVTMKNGDSISYLLIDKEVKNDLIKYDSLRKRISNSESIKKLDEAFIDKLKKRNDDFLKEKEKEKDGLVRDVVIINLIGRYFLIFSCMVGFVVLVWAYSKYQFRDDVFE